MEAVLLGLISGVCGLISAVIVAKSTTDKLVHQLEMNQAVQDEKINSYQRVTNEKIDDLRRQNEAQAEWGTRIALLEEWKKRMESEVK